MFEQASIATKFRPLFDRVLVKRLDAVKQTKGGIMLPESAAKKIREATVIAVGPGARTQVHKLFHKEDSHLHVLSPSY